jgi:hypothetical protein
MNGSTFQISERPEGGKFTTDDPDVFRRAIRAWYANTDDGNTAHRPLVSVERESIDSATTNRAESV